MTGNKAGNQPIAAFLPGLNRAAHSEFEPDDQ